MEAAAYLAVLLADHKTVCEDMRMLARSLGTERFQHEIEDSVVAARAPGFLSGLLGSACCLLLLASHDGQRATRWRSDEAGQPS